MKNIKIIVNILLFLLVAILAILYSNTPIFMDEEEIITGGWLITKGYVIFKDFFVHHMPFSYCLFSLPMFIFKHPSIYFLRCITNFSLIFILLFLGIYSKKGLRQFWILYYIFILLLCFPFFDGYWTILADTSFAVASLAIFLTVLDKPKCDFSYFQKFIISISIFVSITSTLISVYPILFFMIYYYIIRIINNKVDVINYKDIGHFDSNKVIINYSDGSVVIKGNNLVVSKLMNDEILIGGEIKGLELR